MYTNLLFFFEKRRRVMKQNGVVRLIEKHNMSEDEYNSIYMTTSIDCSELIDWEIF